MCNVEHCKNRSQYLVLADLLFDQVLTSEPLKSCSYVSLKADDTLLTLT